MIFAGYDCAINAVQDYFYGDKPNIGLALPTLCQDSLKEPSETAEKSEYGSNEMPVSSEISLATGESPLFCSDNEALGGDQPAESEQPVAETTASQPSSDASLPHQEGDRKATVETASDELGSSPSPQSDNRESNLESVSGKSESTKSVPEPRSDTEAHRDIGIIKSRDEIVTDTDVTEPSKPTEPDETPSVSESN